MQEIPGHTNVSLWYIFNGNIAQPLQIDTSTFTQAQLFSIENIPQGSGPHMLRFTQKIKHFLEKTQSLVC